MFKMECMLSSTVVNKTENIPRPRDVGIRGSELEAMEEEDGGFEKPVRKKKLKRVLRAKKRVAGHRLNTSRLHGHCINSSLNSTLLKQTLRTNNRALAKALEMKRQDLNVAQQIITQLQEEQHQTQQELRNLQYVAGLKDNAIETEVQVRIQSRMEDTKKVLSKVCMQLLSTVELIHGALDISSGRSSSLSRPNTPAEDSMPSTHKVVFYNGPRTSSEPPCSLPAAPDIDIVAVSEALDRSLGDVELAVNAVTGHPDLSVILEQSQFMDSMPIPFTDDDQSEGQHILPVCSSHSRQQKGSDRRARHVFPPACITLTPPPAQHSSDVTVIGACLSQHSSPGVPVVKSLLAATNSSSSPDKFENMSQEEAFGRRDAGCYSAEDRPLPTTAKKQTYHDDGVKAETSQCRVGDFPGCHETSADCFKKRSKLKRASRVKVASVSQQGACSIDTLTAPSDKVMIDGNVNCERRGTFVVRQVCASVEEAQGNLDAGIEENMRETEEGAEGILDEEFGNILVTDIEDDILTVSPIVETKTKCMGNVIQEQTTYSDEDMDMTEVLNVPLVLSDGKVSLLDFVNKESAHEPSFLANVTITGEKKHVASKEPNITTSKVVVKNSSKKADKTLKRKLNLKKGNDITTRKSSSKKLTKKVDSLASDNKAKLAGDEISTIETETKKFSTYIKKPGQMSFTTGKLDQMAPPKGTSLLPRVTARSKPRAKTNKNIDIPVKDATNEPKSVFDLSLNESVIMVRTKYSDFREHYNALSSNGSSSDDTSSNVNVGESPHGIMLTLGNGKRTKPRRARSKQVSYASYTVDAVAPMSDVAKPDDQPSSTGETQQSADGDNLDNCPQSGDDNAFDSGDAVPGPAIGQSKRQRKCRSVVCIVDSPDVSLSSADDITGITESATSKVTLSRKCKQASGRCVAPNNMTNAVMMEGDDIATEEVVSVVDDIHKHGNKESKRVSEKDNQRLIHEESPDDKSVENRERCHRSITEKEKEKQTNKASSRRESKVKQKEIKLKLKYKKVEKEDESNGKQEDADCKVDVSGVGGTDTRSKMNKKQAESKEKFVSCRVKEIESKMKQKDAESKVQQKEAKKPEHGRPKQQVGLRPKVREETSESGDGLKTEKRRSSRSTVNGASCRRQDDKENDNVSQSCTNEKVQRHSVQTGKHSVANRKRSADDGRETTRAQSTAVSEKQRISVARESVIGRVSVSLSDPSPSKRRRRAASSVNYKEPSLHQKLRQGDPHTTSVYANNNDETVVPSVILAIKKKTEVRLSRRPLDTITNNGSSTFVDQTSDVKCP